MIELSLISAFLVLLVGAFRGTEIIPAARAAKEIGLVKNLGSIMFSEFLLPFEVTSLLLLASMVGAVMLGKNK